MSDITVNDNLAAWLRTKADKIRSIQQSMCVSVVELGRELAEVRTHCAENGYERWVDWVQDHCHIVRWQADKYIAVFERYSELPADVQSRVGNLGVEKMYKLSLIPAEVDLVKLLDAQVFDGRKVDDLTKTEVAKLVSYFQKHPDAMLDRLPDILGSETMDKIASTRVQQTPEYRRLAHDAESFRTKVEAQESKLDQAQGRESQLRIRVGELEEQLKTAKEGEVETLRVTVNEVLTELDKVKKTVETETERRAKMFSQLGEQFRRAVMSATSQVQGGTSEVMASITALVGAVGSGGLSATTARWGLEQVAVMGDAVEGLRKSMIEYYASEGIEFEKLD